MQEAQDYQKFDRVQALGHGLSRLALEQVGIRQQIEERWLSDLEQYMGLYDAATLERLKKNNGSQAFVNITRPKTTAAEARLSDMLFPSDDKNWAIQPTPVPELSYMSQNDGAALDANDQPITNDDGAFVTYAEIAKQEIDEATKRSKDMEKEIDDQLQEANYHAIARNAIHDACTFGTGIVKGPIVINRQRKKWFELEAGVYQLDMVNEFRPGVEHIKVWDFFPDMSATSIDECRFIFERRYVTKKQLINLAKRPGYMIDNIRKVVINEPRAWSGTGSHHISKIRQLSGINANIDDGRYEMWEYHGTVEAQTLIDCGCDVDDDPLQEYDVVVSFIDNFVIKVDLNPLETNEHPYSVFSYEEDDTSVFGFGIPYLLRNEQRIANAAWRMILDNAALSTSGQVVINREIVTPSDGSWALVAGKVWWLNDPNFKVEDVFKVNEIPSHQSELTAIFQIARDMADDVTSLPMLAQGEKGDAPNTASGMSMLMNSANVVIRRVVKSFDDNVTSPFITRFYDWNMQNSEKEEIKGDFEISARGSSALLVKETQTQALMSMMSFAQQPVFGELTKHAELYRKVAQAQHISPDEVIKTDDELEAEKVSMGAQNNDADAERQLKMQIAQLESQTDIEVARIRSLNESERTGIDFRKKKLEEDNKANLFLAEREFALNEGEGRGL